MNEIIVKALEVNATTIIPNVGAFMKMGKSILFNEFLKYDDGKLANFIAEQKSIDFAQAKEEVLKYSKSLTSDLDAGKTVQFDGIGELKKEDGKLKLVPSTSSETKSTPKVKKEEIKPVVVTPPKVEETKQEPEVKKTEEEKPKEVELPKKVVVNKTLATDFGAQDAIDKIKEFTNKSDLIDFTRGEKRKTVIDALNKKLDALNGKTETKEEVKTEAPVEVKTEKPLEDIKPQIEVKNEEEQPVQKPIDKKEELKKEEPKVVVPVVETPILKEIEKPVVVNEIPKPKEELKNIAKKEEEIDTADTETIITPPSSTRDKKEKKSLDEKEIIAISKSVDETEKQLKKRKRRRLVLLLAIIFILGGGGTLGYLKKDVIMAYFEKEHTPKELASNESDDQSSETKNENSENNSTEENTETTPENDNEVTEELVEETIEEASVEEVVEEVIEEPLEEVVEEVPVNNSTSDGQSSFGKYHIVSGSYSSEENANNKVKELQSKGYKDAKILGLVNGLHTVRAMSFDDLESAKSALKEFKESGNKGFVKKI